MDKAMRTQEPRCPCAYARAHMQEVSLGSSPEALVWTPAAIMERSQQLVALLQEVVYLNIERPAACCRHGANSCMLCIARMATRV